MTRIDVEINTVPYSTLFALSDDFNQAFNRYIEMKSSGLRPTINVLVSLLKNAGNKENIAHLEREKQALDIPSNPAWEIHLRSKWAKLS